MDTLRSYRGELRGQRTPPSLIMELTTPCAFEAQSLKQIYKKGITSSQINLLYTLTEQMISPTQSPAASAILFSVI